MNSKVCRASFWGEEKCAKIDRGDSCTYLNGLKPIKLYTFNVQFKRGIVWHMNNTSIKLVRKIQGKYLSQLKKCEFELLAWSSSENQPTRLVSVGKGRGQRAQPRRPKRQSSPAAGAGRCLQAGRGKQAELGVPGRQGKEDTASTSSRQLTFPDYPHWPWVTPVLSSTEVQYCRVLILYRVVQ